MRNYASKSNARVTRYRTPSSFKVRKSAGFGKKEQIRLPYHPPSRGKSGLTSK